MTFLYLRLYSGLSMSVPFLIHSYLPLPFLSHGASLLTCLRELGVRIFGWTVSGHKSPLNYISFTTKLLGPTYVCLFESYTLTVSPEKKVGCLPTIMLEVNFTTSMYTVRWACITNAEIFRRAGETPVSEMVNTG